MTDLDSEVESLPASFVGSASQLTSSSQPQQCLVEDECLYKGRRSTCIDHQPNRRSGSPRSKIWEHSFEYRLAGAIDCSKFWRCRHCRKTLLIDVNDTTKSVLRHLRVLHPQQLVRIGDISNSRSIPDSQKTNSISSLVFTLDIAKFRWLLIRWIVCMQIAFSCVESQEFQDLLSYISPSLGKYMVATGHTIKNWILEEYRQAAVEIKKELSSACSRVHISFDLWTAPNQHTFCGVVAHYLGDDLKNHSILIGLRPVTGHSGENIAEAVIPVIREFINPQRLGLFQAGNASANDNAFRCILRELQPDIKDLDSRRVRCLAHIINLAAKAFLFGKDADAFEANSGRCRTQKEIEQLQRIWRQKGPVGKFHNIVVFIRASSQRRTAFRQCVGDEDCRDLMVILDNDTRWNSVYLSLSRSLELQLRIQVFCTHYKEELNEDLLSDSD
jgi:BED zinc finger